MTMHIIENHCLAGHTTMGVGGNARFYAEVKSVRELEEALELAKSKGLPVFFLGGGSNTLINDDGFDGMVIRMAIGEVVFEGGTDSGIHEAEEIRMISGAGVQLDEAVDLACRNDLAGIESLSGIPGSIGGAVVQNAGAYGQEIADAFVAAKAVHRESLKIVELTASDLGFGYRRTNLKTADNPWVIISVMLRLRPFDAEIAYRRCVEHGFGKLLQKPPENAVVLRQIILDTRHSKGMCYQKDDVNTHGVGSFFVNPVVSRTFAETLPEMPKFDVPGGVKRSAGWLIEHSGFTRGFRCGKAALSEKHCLALVNRGGASCREILALAKQVSDKVFSTYGVRLVPEAVYLAPSGVRNVSLNDCPSRE